MTVRNRTIIWLVGLAVLWAVLCTAWISLNPETPVIRVREGVAAAPIPDDRTVYMVGGEWLVCEGPHTPDILSEAGGYRHVRRMSGHTYTFTMGVTEGSEYYFLLPRPHHSRLLVNGISVADEKSGRIVGVRGVQYDGTEVEVMATGGAIVATGGYAANIPMVLETNVYWSTDDLLADIGTINRGLTQGNLDEAAEQACRGTIGNCEQGEGGSHMPDPLIQSTSEPCRGWGTNYSGRPSAHEVYI